MSNLLKGILFDGQVRFTALEDTDLVEAARQTHGTSPLASAALGRTITATAILASDLKGKRDRMSVTIKGDGPAGSIVVAAKANGEIKSFITNPHVDLPLNEVGKLDVGAAVGAGTLTVLKDMGLKEPYMGTVELQSGEIGDDFAYYLLTSEQKPTICYVGVLVDTDCSIKSSSGIVIEPLPDAEADTIIKMESKALEIAKLNSILASGKTLEQALAGLFKDWNMKILEHREPSYLCDCSRDRMERALRSIQNSELVEMAEEDAGAEIVCQFCHKPYQFTAAELIAFANEENE